MAMMVLFALPWVYIWLCDPGAVALNDQQPIAAVINVIATAVGSIIPKANWYAGYFREQGAATLASEITGVYGFCTIILVLYLIAYFCIQRFMPGKPRKLSDEEQLVLLVPASRDRLAYIQKIVLGCGVLTVYYDFFGYGLSPPGILPGESTNGAFVLGGPIFFFAVLAVVVIYFHQSRVFLGRVR